MRSLSANNWRRLWALRGLSNSIHLPDGMSILLLSRELCLLLGSELLPSSLFLSMFLSLPLFKSTAPLSFLLLLLLSLGLLLLQLPLLLSFGLFFELNTNILEGFELGESRFKWCGASSIIDGGLCGARCP